MPSELTLLLGEAGTGKTDRLLERYRRALDDARQRRRPGTVLWIAPTQRAKQAVIDRLLTRDSPVQLAPRVLTFDSFAEQILAASHKPATLLAPVVKRLLLRRIVADLGQRGQLTQFDSVLGTTGFLDVVSGMISELKREEIWPETFLDACAKRGGRRVKRDRELGQIYEKYQQYLTAHDWYDTEGRFWLARNALQEGVRGPFASTELLVVDGFADFTQTQYEILGHLLTWIPRAYVSIPIERPVRRQELFDKPGATERALRQHLPRDTAVTIEAPGTSAVDRPAGLRTIARDLFFNTQIVAPVEDASGIEIVAATGPLGEWQAVAIRIKTLLQSEIRPAEIVIAVRSIAQAGPAWRDYLAEAGLPAWCDAGTSLASRPIIKTLFSILQLELEDWPFQRLLQVLNSNYFQPNWPEVSRGTGVRAVGAALRRLKLHAGRELILKVLERAASGLASEDDPDANLNPSAAASVPALARHAESILKRLLQATSRLRQKHTLAEWSDVIGSLGAELGWSHVAPATDFAARDASDWDLLQRILRTAADADRRLVLSAETRSGKPPKLDLAAWTAELRDLLAGESIRSTADPGGCVRILDVEQARHLNVPYLFVAGLTESSFPSNRGDDCLFGEAERREFADHDVKLKHRELHQRDEMFLFYSTVTQARRQLTLSYPAVNGKGQPLFASPYVVAVRSLFSEAALPIHFEGQLDPVPTPERVLTEADLRLLAVHETSFGRGGLFARWGTRAEWARTCENVLAAVDVNVNRFHERGLGGYEGRLESATNLAALRQRYSVHHQFSATELEAYATCPYKFWVEHVLRVEDLPTPEEGTDHLARGNLVHSVLAQLLREGLDRSAEELGQRFHEILEQHLSRRLHETDLQRALSAIELRLLSRWGEAFGRQQADYAAKVSDAWNSMSSLAPELPFGSVPGQDADPELQQAPLIFGDDQSLVRLRGRIDRVDTGRAGGKPVFTVIDYKTGARPRASLSDLETGRTIQLALYALAVQRLGLAGVETEPFQLGYWSLRSTGFKRGYQRDAKSFSPMDSTLVRNLAETLESVIPQLATGIRQGKFLVENSDESCTSHCALHTTCRVNQIRHVKDSLQKVADILAPTGRPMSDSDEDSE